MFFRPDNTGPVHPQIMATLAEANEGYTASSGADPLMDEVRNRIRAIFEAPEAEVFLVATGTAANCLALSCYCPPTHTVFCSPVAHIHEDECNGPEFYTGGGKLTLVGTEDKLTPEALRTAIEGEEIRGVHGPQRGPISITQATEKGQVFSVTELTALTAVARDYGLPVHMDGARFANALVAANCTPAEMTWRAGVDVLSFGGTKNGCMGVEAVVLFDPAKAWEFQLRRKRAAHLFSKHRYLSAQMAGYLREDLWKDTARTANAKMTRLADGLRKNPDARFVYEPQVNMAFVDLPCGTLRKLKAAGAVFNLYTGSLETSGEDEMLTTRLVTDWSLPDAEFDRFLTLVTA